MSGARDLVPVCSSTPGNSEYSAAYSGTELVVLPHPLTLEGRTITIGAELLPGDTLSEFLARAGVDLALTDWHVTIGGAYVPRDMWRYTRPRNGQVIVVRRTAHKSVLRIVALVAVAYLAVQTGGLVGAAYGAGWGAVASFAVNLVGGLLINRLLPPTRARGSQYSQDNAQTYSLSGGRNRARPMETLPLLFGQVKVVPDLAAQAYSWFEGEEQYQYVRFQAPLNSGTVDTFQIGETPIASYEDVVLSQSGFPGTTTQLTDWANVDSIAGALLTAPTAPGAWVTRTSSAASVRLAVDIAAQLYDMAGDGTFNTATLDLEIEKRLLPGGTFGPFVGGSATLTLSSKGTKPVRVTVVSDALTAGQYEVRVRKMTADVSTSTQANTVEWAVLKSYQLDSGAYASYPQIGVRIRASGQLNGSLDELSAVFSQAAVPVWNGSSFVTQTTRNPGAQMLQFARGIFDGTGRLIAGLGLPDAQIDIEGLKAFTVHCTTNSYVFDHVFDSQVSCFEVLEAMAAAGMGSVSYHPGSLSVVWATSADPVEDIVSMANIKAGTFRVDYSTRTTADEIEVTWFDRDEGWKPRTVRVLAPGVTAPRDTARVAPLGVTTAAGGLRTARVAMAQNVYQRQAVSWEMDLEYLNFRRYSVIELSHDMTQWGYSGRLQGAVAPGGVVTIYLDQKVPTSGSPTRKVGIRVPGEVGYRLFTVNAYGSETDQLTLAEAWPGGVPFPGDSASNPAHDYVFIFDFKATPGKRLRVVQIEPSDDMAGARITAVPETSEFWTFVTSGAYTFPPLAPGLGPVVVSSLVVTQGRVAINYDQSTTLTLTFDADGPFDHAQVWGALTGSPLELVGETRTRSFGPVRVGNDGTYDIELRPFDQLGRAGAVGTISHTVTLDPPQSGGSGNYTQFVFKRAATQPATPTGNGIPSGWSDAPPAADGNPLWFSIAEQAPGGITIGSWSAPVSPDGAGLQIEYSVDGATGWHSTFTTGDLYARWRAGSGGAWSAAIKIVGEDGDAAQTLALTATGFAFVFADASATTSSSPTITFNAVLQNVTGTASWAAVAYNAAGSSLGSVTLGGSGNTRTMTAAQFNSLGATTTRYVTVTATLGSLTDTTTVYRGDDGSDAVQAVLSNEAHTLQANAAGTVSSYSGSGTTIRVFEGVTELDYDGVGTANGKWTVSSSSSNITRGSLTDSGQFLTVGNHSAMTADQATITYTISGKTTAGAAFSFDKVQSFAKSREGAQGATGATGPTGSTGPTGATGQSNHRVYRAATIGSPPSTPGNTTSGATPAGWSATPVTLTTGQEQYQSDGTTPAGSTTTTWGTPYPSYLKVGDLSAISANLGTVTAGNISGTANISITGSATFRGVNSSVVIPDPNSSGAGPFTSYSTAVLANETSAANIGLAAFATLSGSGAIVGYNASTGSSSAGVFGRGANGVWGVTFQSGRSGVRGIGNASGATGVYGAGGGSGGWGVVAEDNAVGGSPAGGGALDVIGKGRISGQFTSTLATGTSPFAVTSTTLCANLNADLLDGEHAAGLVKSIGANRAELGNTTTGSATATFTSTNKPGSASSNVWLEMRHGGNTFWVPAWPNA